MGRDIACAAKKPAIESDIDTENYDLSLEKARSSGTEMQQSSTIPVTSCTTLPQS